jgi:L-serine dehydratase
MAAERFAAANTKAASYRVVLYGSLAATGKGHMTDLSIENALKPKPVQFEWRSGVYLPFHANAMSISALDEKGDTFRESTYYSVGGGAIQEEGSINDPPDLYPNLGMTSLIQWSRKSGRPLWDLVYEKEDDGIEDFLLEVWTVMQEAVKRGLETQGVLPGELKLARRANVFYRKSRISNQVFQRSGLLYSYALAVSEENAALGKVVTAPTCGSAGIMPSVLKYLKELLELSDSDIVKALATASLIGNIVKTRATISGAAGGCQAEVGTACAMAAAAAVQLMGGSAMQIEYAAEMGLEHHLGLTCDPVKGLVQIPCIERNAAGATRAFACAEFSMLADGEHRISFDEVVETMRQTGMDMNSRYRETSTGGLARHTKISRTPNAGIR